MNSPPKIKILLVEDNPGDARLVEEQLKESGETEFEIVHVQRISEAVARLQAETFSLVLLDLSLPDSLGQETVLKLRLQIPDLPIVVLTGLDDEAVATQAVQAGAQDYLVKGQMDKKMLTRFVRYGIERHHLQMALNNLSLRDNLTGLYNAQGFLTLAGQQVKLAASQQARQTPGKAESTDRKELKHDAASPAPSHLMLVCADVDQLAAINQQFGHQAGNRALIQTAEVFRQTFRDSDIIARWGGDEFVILVIGALEGQARQLLKRLQGYVTQTNTQGYQPFTLSLSVGFASLPPDGSMSLEAAIIRAELSLLKEKNRKKNPEGNETPLKSEGAS